MPDHPEIILGQKRGVGELISQPITLKNDLVIAKLDVQGAYLNQLLIDGINLIWRRFPLAELGRASRRRGGVPVLGPTPGPVAGTTWLEKGVPETMPSHGTDRQVPWRVKIISAERLVLSRQIERKEFGSGPWKKSIEVVLIQRGIILTAKVVNLSEKEGEIGHAWHPYFRRRGLVLSKDIEDVVKVGDLTKSIVTSGSRIGRKVEFEFKGALYRLVVNPLPENWVLWSDCPEKYIAIEPWWAGIGYGVAVPPGQSTSFSMILERVGD